jgi:hypothetical protein
MITRQQSADTPLVFQLSSVSAYTTFGGLLHAKRNHHHTTFRQALTPKKLTRATNDLLQAKDEVLMAGRAYNDLESGRRFPRFCELEALFRAFVETFGVEFTDLEITAYVHLARAKFEEKLKQKEEIAEDAWTTLLDTLFHIQKMKRANIHLVTEEKTQPDTAGTLVEDPHSRRRQAIQTARDTDLRHLLERGEWVQRMLTYPQMDPQVKLVINRGPSGVGKSYANALLIQQLGEQAPDAYLIPYLFRAGQEKTPEDYLDELVSTVLADLTMRASDDTKQSPLEQRVSQLLSEIKKREGRKVILLLDNAHLLFSAAGEWSPAVLAFLETFVREPHNATLYLFTRVWPGWDESLDYIEQSELVPLSPAISVALWQKRGFADVPEALLQEICARSGYNPQLMNMLMAQCKKAFTLQSWGPSGALSAQASANTDRIKTLLSQETLFETLDRSARGVLQNAFTSQLNHQARQMLECLALSPLGLPFKLLFEEFPRASEALSELESVSALDRSMAAAHRAAIDPLVREAVVQALTSDGRKDGVEMRVTDLYGYWLHEMQNFRDDHEKAALITEVSVRHLKAGQLLKAAELLVSFGWLCSLFGQVNRIKRVFDEYVSTNRGRNEDTEHEVGRLILEHHTRLRLNGMRDEERDQIYQDIYDLVITGKVQLPANCELTVAQHIFLVYLRRSLFVEASQMFEETLTRLQQSSQLTPEIYASYLYYKSRLLARWWDKSSLAQDQSEVERLKQECVATLEESVAHWRKCLRNPLPLQMHYVNFKLARSLNDYAYRMRLCGNLEMAQKAIEESIRLKKASGTLQHSVAISLSEYSQILVTQGKMRQALACNQDAIDIIERLIQEGNTAHTPNLGMFLVERADILRAQARLAEARLLLERAVILIGDQQLRQEFRSRAKRDIQEINHILAQPHDYHLDDRWFPLYSDLSSFDNLAWMAHAGPFNVDEQNEWEQLLQHRTEEQASSRMATLIVQSRRREFDLCQREGRAPHLWYPMIPLDEVQARLNGFEQLRKEIESEEPNAVVRSLYLDIIQERITILRQCQATALRDQQTVWQCNLDLYGKPEEQEVYIALHMYHRMLSEVREDEPAWPVVQEVLQQLKSWGLSPREVEKHCVLTQGAVLPFRAKKSGDEQEFSHIVAQRFFQDVLLHEYRAEGWRVEIAPARDGVYIDVDLRTLFLPPKPLSLEKIRQLLAEEIEIHAYRSFSGQRSPIRLLGSGLAGYSATEEGLATYYEQQIALQVNGGKKPSTWIGTLAIALATGILTPALSFLELVSFFEKFLLIHRWLTVGGSWETTVKWAREQAWARAARTCRGVPNLSEMGCCSLKDRIYQLGYEEVLRFLETNNEEALYVGKAAIKHLDLLAELNIVTPYYPHRRLALAPDLSARLSQYKD